MQITNQPLQLLRKLYSILCYNSKMTAERPDALYTRKKISPEGKEKVSRSGNAVFWYGQERYPGIGSWLPDASPATHQIYEEASEVFQVGIPQLTLSDGGQHTTLEVQMANAAADLAWYELACAKNPQLRNPRILLGESYGEIVALRRMLKSNKDFFTCIKTRGTIMRDAALEHEAASGEKTGLIGVSIRRSKSPEERREKQEALVRISDELTNEKNNLGIYLATKTSRSRYAFGGTQSALDNALEYLKKEYRQYVLGVDLKTGAAFHTPLYTGVKEPLAEWFKDPPVEFQDPDVPVLSATRPKPVILDSWQDGVEEILRHPEEPVYCVEMFDFVERIMRVKDIYIIGEKSDIADHFAEDPDQYVAEPIVTKGRVAKAAGALGTMGALGVAAWKISHTDSGRGRN